MAVACQDPPFSTAAAREAAEQDAAMDVADTFGGFDDDKPAAKKSGGRIRSRPPECESSSIEEHTSTCEPTPSDMMGEWGDPEWYLGT